MYLKRIMIYLPLSAALWAIGGCAGGPEVARERLFFPFPPDTPRLEFIHAYQSDGNFPKSAAKIRMEAILGKDPVQSLGRPTDAVSDGEGKMYVADTEEKNVWIYDLVNYKLTKLTNDPLFITPVGLAVDGEGTLYVADSAQEKIYVFDKETHPLFNISEKNIPDAAESKWTPVAVAVDDKLGRVYVTDRGNHRVDVFDKEAAHLFSFGERGNVDGAFNFPLDIEVAPDGRVVVVDTMNARIQIFDSEGKFLKKFGRRGSSPDSFGLLKGVGIDTDGHIYLTDADTRLVKIFDLDGNYLMSLGGAAYASEPGKPLTIGGFNVLSGVSVDKKNRLFIVDEMNRMVQVFQYLDEAYLQEHPLPKVLPPSPHREEPKSREKADNASR